MTNVVPDLGDDLRLRLPPAVLPVGSMGDGGSPERNNEKNLPDLTPTFPSRS
jgi:hypothetical protein